MSATTSKPTNQLIAAIDVGTNSFHMVVASVTTRGVLRIHARSKETVRLGSAGGDMKKLSSEAMTRGLATLKRFAVEAKQHQAFIRAVATSAVREALNKDDFLDRVLDDTGIAIEVVSGMEEGRLIYVGALHALPIHSKPTLVLDIGGGSTETVIGYKGEVTYVHSAKLGHIRMSTRFFGKGDATTEAIEACRQAIRGDWASVFQSLLEYGFETAVGCSGTILTIATMALVMHDKRVPESMNGVRIPRADILAAIDAIVGARSVKARQALPGMDARRADVVLGGALILEQAVLGLNIQELVISGYSLREGVVFDTVQKQRDINQYHHLSHLRYQSVDHLCELYHVRRPHAEHVKDLSLKLFDDLITEHHLGDRERELLEAAALLHDVGYYISADQHHKHSDYIIRNSSMPGFTLDESELIASVARYHRKSHPKKKHENFLRLPDEDQQVVRVLASILRICEGLDRRQQQVVRTVRAEVTAGSIDIYLHTTADVPDIEVWGAERRKGLLEEVFMRSVILRLAE